MVLSLAPSLASADLGLHRVIPLPGIRGALGHLAVDPGQQRLFACVAGEDRLVVVDLADGAVTGQLRGLDRPRGVVYLPGSDRVAVSNAGSGELGLYAAASLTPDGAINFGGSADGLVYDAGQDRVYLGYGSNTGGGIAVVSAAGQPLQQFSLATRPAGFVVDSKARRLYVNLPARRTVAVFDLTNNQRVATWTLGAGSGRNSAMALDAAAQRLFIASDGPDRILALDTQNGERLQSLPAPADVGSLSFDAVTRELYAAGGLGRLVVYAVAASGELQQTDDIPTARGAGQALLDAAHGRYYLAIPARSRQPAEIRVYNVTAAEPGAAG